MKRPKLNLNIGSIQTALKKHRDSLGKETKQHHYINELRLIKFAMTGDSKQAYDLSNPPREHLTMLRRVICMNRRLIGMHVPYALRKQACRDFVLKKLTVKRT
jgi:hypothetical protein